MVESRRPLQVKKDRLSVVIFTDHLKITGEIHLLGGGRLTDFINRDMERIPLVAVTNARCYLYPQDTFLYSTDFVSVNKNHIHLISPFHEGQERANEEEGPGEENR